MGERTFVNPSVLKQSKTRAAKRPGHGMDWILLGVVVALTLFGLLMVYSAGTKFALDSDYPPEHFAQRQLMWAGISMVALAVLSRFPYQYFKRLTVLMMFVTMILLVAVAAFTDDTTLNANRSIFEGSVRPSELAKLVTIIYVSVWLYSKRDVLNDISLGLIPLAMILGITGALILWQPDISAAITIIILGGILFFLAGGEWRQIGLTIAGTVIFGWVVINFYSTGIKRMTDYITGLRNPMEASYHVQRSLEAVINGGLFGVGIGHGSTKFTGLPVAITDSIFAVIAEETGLIGAGLIILAYLVLIWRGLEIASHAPDKLGSLLASGITVWIGVEAMLNMAVMVNLLPHAGNGLPFISYGGSSLLMTLSGIGILLNVARQSGQSEPSQGGNPFGSIINLRGWDRRGRVSRTGRPSGARQTR